MISEFIRRTRCGSGELTHLTQTEKGFVSLVHGSRLSLVGKLMIAS